ncbi:phospholipase D/nuclease, partial [Aureobasidium melanogenum]
MAFLFDKVHKAVHEIGNDLKDKFSEHGQTQSAGANEQYGQSAYNDPHETHRFQSFAPHRIGNEVKWYVDGAGYMHAVSMALERARESIWIMDWWLSPELYLRRPPAQNEQYRVDRMLKAAAERGVQVNILIYKEVTQALTRKCLNPVLPDFLHSLLPRSVDRVSSALIRFGMDVTFKSLEILEETNPLISPPITVSSAHTKHALEQLHPNIRVFRHPDHLPDTQVLASSFLSSLQVMKVTAANLAKLPGDAIKSVYGMNEDTVLYWAHHEKACLIDSHIAFMGGLDLCYGRWDTNQHSISDAHPSDLNQIIFPGQDYNNARILDFSDVAHWDQNKLDRRYNSRMGWSDLSISLAGPVVEDLRRHFAERWNFIYNEKYRSKNDNDRYGPLHVPESRTGIVHHEYPCAPGAPLPEHMRERMMERWEEGRERMEGFREQVRHHFPSSGHPPPPPGMPCQIIRSCSKWSHGTKTEHSIQNAYIEVIRNSHHFVYIENQFFITATSDSQRPIKNQIGAAIVERIIRAAREGEPYQVIVIMPAIPAFAGDLKSDEALGTREIMELQYDSINRGGHSIMESIAREGIDPMQYIRFYNLRNYDRINSSGAMREAEQQSGVSYDDARQEYDQRYGGSEGYAQEGAYNNQYQQYDGGAYDEQGGQYDRFQRYQQATQNMGNHSGLGSGRWDSVAECYMLNGEDIRNVPWEDGTTDEMDAIVSELLYVHSKILIADDRVVICGSANLNDRSQLGDHDSEIAICIEDPREIDSYMAGRPWRATEFAASLRRQLFRKHLGLLPPQDFTRPDRNFEPIGVPNAYDWGSREDEAVVDPLSLDFLSLWNTTARTNTEAFERVFHPVPSDKVRNWKQYDEYFSRFFPTGKDAKEERGKDAEKPSQWKLGHVVSEEFPGGVAEVKDVLSMIRGTLVEMPLLFLKEEDMAKEGLTLNAMTEEIYT